MLLIGIIIFIIIKNNNIVNFVLVVDWQCSES